MSEYDMKIHDSRDAKEWAKFFIATWENKIEKPDEADMVGWFANAMMAMHDSIYRSEIKDLQTENRDLWSVVDHYSEVGLIAKKKYKRD